MASAVRLCGCAAVRRAWLLVLPADGAASASATQQCHGRCATQILALAYILTTMLAV